MPESKTSQVRRNLIRMNVSTLAGYVDKGDYRSIYLLCNVLSALAKAEEEGLD